MFRQLSSGDGYKGWFLHWIEEWSQFFEPSNWRTFHPIFIEMEDDRIMGGVEATVIILGVGVRLRWNYTITDETAGVLQSVADIKSGKVAPSDLHAL